MSRKKPDDVEKMNDRQRLEGSREWSLFHGNLNTSNGVVLESLWNHHDPITHTVIDFAKKKTVYVLPTCFNVRENYDTRSQRTKDLRPYEVFENVNFVADEDGCVRQYIARNQKKWECFNMGNDIFAVKSFCVFSEDEPPRCFTDVVGEVPCDPSVSSKVLLRNVTFDCHVQFNFTSAVEFYHGANNDVTFHLFKVDGVNPDKFDFALTAPWLLDAKRPMYDPCDPFAAQLDPIKEKNIPGIHGYMLPGKTFYIPTKPRWRVALAFNQIGSILYSEYLPVEPNMALTVDIRFNYTIDKFVIFEAGMNKSGGLRTEVVDNNFVRGPIRAINECFGFFLLSNDSLVFDKYGLLSNLYANMGTTIADFGYMDPDERAYTTLVVSDADINNSLNMKDMKFEALCINKKEFYCSHLHNFLLVAVGEYEVGKWYNIVLLKVDSDDYIAEVKPTLIQKAPVECKCVRGVYEFTIPYMLHRSGNFQFLLCENIGPIGFLDDQITPVPHSKKLCTIQFGKPFKDIEERPQVRPKFIRFVRE